MEKDSYGGMGAFNKTAVYYVRLIRYQFSSQ